MKIVGGIIISMNQFSGLLKTRERVKMSNYLGKTGKSKGYLEGPGSCGGVGEYLAALVNEKFNSRVLS